MRVANRRVLRPAEKIRVLIVDDSVVIRRLITHALEERNTLEVVGAAADGAIALARIPQLNPDVVTLDIEMPVMDGMETLRRIRRDYPQTRVIMFSTLTERGAAITMEALHSGADDYVTKESNDGSLDRSLARLRQELIPRIEQFFVLPGQAPAPGAPIVRPFLASPMSGPAIAPKAVAIGVSTGGPAALSQLLPAFPSSFPLPVLVVQHMPPLFTRLLAERLNSICPLTVTEAREGDRVQAGTVLIAPGDFHMMIVPGKSGASVHLEQSPPQNSCRPAVDALFASLSATYGGAVLPVILTGMGEDGLRGSRTLRAQGACVIAQDEASSVVWGMPGAVVRAGLASHILPLNGIANAVLKHAGCA